MDISYRQRVDTLVGCAPCLHNCRAIMGPPDLHPHGVMVATIAYSNGPSHRYPTSLKRPKLNPNSGRQGTRADARQRATIGSSLTSRRNAPRVSALALEHYSGHKVGRPKAPSLVASSDRRVIGIPTGAHELPIGQ
jgi:hypothetical protein